MKSLILVFLLAIASVSCKSPSNHLVLITSDSTKLSYINLEEKIVILSINEYDGGSKITYKVKRLPTSTVTFVKIDCYTLYSVQDTLLWKF